MSYWAESMLLWSGQALVLIGVLFIVGRALRRNSAAERHSLWLAGLLVIAMLPAANVFLRSFATTLPSAEPVRLITSLPEAVAVTSPGIRTRTPLADVPGVEGQGTAASWLPSLMTVLFGAWLVGILISIYQPVRC